MTTMDLLKASRLVYPVMLAQEVGEITEKKACELLGLTLIDYREAKENAVKAVVGLCAGTNAFAVMLKSNHVKPQ